jgi:hypothetical protein
MYAKIAGGGMAMVPPPTQYYRRGRKRPNRYHRVGRGQYYSNTIKQVVQDVRKLKNLINVEFKSLDKDGSITLTNPDSSGKVYLLNGCAQNDTGEGRDGLSIKMQSLQYTLMITQDTNQQNPVLVRVMFVLDTAPDGVELTPAELLDSSFPYYRSFRNLIHRKRLITLRDSKFILAPFGDPDSKWVKDEYIKLGVKGQGIHTIYSGSASDITGISANALYCLIFSDAGLGFLPEISLSARIRFLDN